MIATVNKKSQSMLVASIVHLVSIILFFIVLVTLLSSYYRVRFVINDFDMETESLNVVRRLVSSADCFASEERDIMWSSTGNPVMGYRIYPGLLDLNKMTSAYNFNCMRKDSFDLGQDLHNGTANPLEGSGALAKYDIIALKSGSAYPWVYQYDTGTESYYNATSWVGRINKKADSCCRASSWCSATDSKCSYDGNAFSITFCKDYSSSPCDSSGSCSINNPTYGTCSTGESYSPLWQVYGKNPNGGDIIGYTLGKTVDFNLEKDENGDITGVSLSQWNQRDLTCGESGIRYVVPFYFDDHNAKEYKTGLMVISFCDIKGAKYVGLSLPEIIYKMRFNK